jgi:predicted Zn-dependent protease
MITSAFFVWVLLAAPFAALAQTEIRMPKNKYKIHDDIKIGAEYSQKVESEFPMIDQRESSDYLAEVGNRLVAAIPGEFQHPEFEYRFRIVNASDINAFALPGGPMYVNRGMIQAAKNEGEMAGVMAHEISHVALRHGTAQATKQSNPLNQILGIGAILGGAVLGGQTGAQLGAMFAAGYFLRYSREYENQADILGARILANAGYDPRDLANMFKTINEQSQGGRSPEWLSSHPNPENRYEAINREAGLLRVSREPIKYTRGFGRTREYLQSLAPAKTMAEIQKNTGETGSQGADTGMSAGRYEGRVQYPSNSTRTYRAGNTISMSVPENWSQFESESEVWFAPVGAYGDQGITRGAIAGIKSTSQRTLSAASEEYVNSLLQANTYLRQDTGYSRTTIDGRTAYAVKLSGRSPITGQTENVLIYTAGMRNGTLLYIVGVAPDNESYYYNRAFNNMVRSVRLND